MTEEEREALVRLADMMVPARHGLPSAGETLGRWLRTAEVAQPAIVAEVAAVGNQAIVEGDREVMQLIARGGAATFSAVVLEAWFRDANVRGHFAYHGVTPAAAVTDAEALRARVAAVAHRPAPAGTAADVPDAVVIPGGTE